MSQGQITELTGDDLQEIVGSSRVKEFELESTLRTVLSWTPEIRVIRYWRPNVPEMSTAEDLRRLIAFNGTLSLTRDPISGYFSITLFFREGKVVRKYWYEGGLRTAFP